MKYTFNYILERKNYLNIVGAAVEVLSENAKHSRLIEGASVIPFAINHWRICSATVWVINRGSLMSLREASTI